MSAKQSPSRQLPPNPSFEQLKNQARDLLKAHKGGTPEACLRIQASLRRLRDASEDEIRNARFSLRDAQSVLAREYGFTSWAKLKAHVEGLQGSTRDRVLQGVSAEDVARAVRSMQGDPQQVGTLMVALGQETAGEVMRYLSNREIDAVTQAIAGLAQVSPEAQDRVLKALPQWLKQDDATVRETGEPAYGDFVLGALEQAVGRPRAARILDRQGIELAEKSRKRKPKLSKKHLAMKRGLERTLRGKPTSEMDLDELREVMVKMGEIARMEGMLGLEAYFGAATQIEDLFCNGMRLAIDGTERAQLAEMLEIKKNALVRSFETRCEMIISGVMGIRDGDNPRIIEQKLVNYYKP